MIDSIQVVTLGFLLSEDFPSVLFACNCTWTTHISHWKPVDLENSFIDFVNVELVPIMLNHLNWKLSVQRWCFDPSFCLNMERLYSCILINLRLVPFEYFQNMDKPVRISKIEFMPGKESRDISTNLTLAMWLKAWVIVMSQIK